MTQLRKKPSATAQLSYSGPTPAAASATRKTAQPRKVAFAPEVFASAAEYDQSVASVVARIQSGQAPPRHPDEYPPPETCRNRKPRQTLAGLSVVRK